MSFWGCILKPGLKSKVDSTEGDILHLSQACLHDPKDGKNYIQANVDGTTYSIACLEKGKKEHDSFDLFFDPHSCSFMNNGKSEVHLTGYFEPDEGDEDGEEEEPPAAPKKAASPKASPKVEAKSSPKVSPKVETKASPKASPAAAPAKSPKVAAAEPAKAAPKAKAAEEDEDDEEEESEEELLEGEEGEEEELLESEEEEEEEEDTKAKPPAKGKAKAKAEAAPAKRKAEPPAAPAKKAKVEASPAAAPAASPKAASGDQAHAGYVKELVAYLKKHGKTPTSLLGSKVQRPKDAPKMKVIFEQNKDKFLISGSDVSAK